MLQLDNRIKFSKMKAIKTLIFISSVVFTRTEPVGRLNLTQNLPTRRILGGKPVGDTRPYMVYLRPAAQAESQVTTTNWLCGGVIIHERYILTSAACIEDAKNFYVVSGTNKWLNMSETNDCITYGAKKAVWKCVPKNYYFDGAEFNNIRWMSGDVAVVKVEDDFNFSRRVRGCDFIPKKIPFNNVSAEYEKAGTLASIAGWGNTNSFGDIDTRRVAENSPELLETDLQVISKKNCKKRWEERYHHIIDEDKICTRSDHQELMSQTCIDQGIKCKELEYTDDYQEDYDTEKEKKDTKRMGTRRVLVVDEEMQVHGAPHINMVDGTRRAKISSGGFCENDHGGPLIVGHGKTSMVVGVISACLTKDVTRKCYGPFLYTSVWTHRFLISCAIDKELSPTCRRSIQTSKSGVSEVTFDWTTHPDGPPKGSKQ